jgi:hypothetical protein
MLRGAFECICCVVDPFELAIASCALGTTPYTVPVMGTVIKVTAAILAVLAVLALCAYLALLLGVTLFTVTQESLFASHQSPRAWYTNATATTKPCVTASKILSSTLSDPTLLTRNSKVASNLHLADQAQRVALSCGSVWAVLPAHFLGMQSGRLPSSPLGTYNLNGSIQNWASTDVYNISQDALQWAESTNPVAAIVAYDADVAVANHDRQLIDAQVSKIHEPAILYRWPIIPPSH